MDITQKLSNSSEYYGSKIFFSAPPPTIQELTLGPEQYYTMLKPNSSIELFLDDFLRPMYEIALPNLHGHEIILLNVVVHIIHALAMTAFVIFISQGLIQFPGHKDGSLFPMYIPEHYGKRNSQHPFDPYRFGTRALTNIMNLYTRDKSE